MMRNIDAMKNVVIGVLGGMGTYATIHLFNEYASVFKAQKEWDRPRIIIDNRSTMPSRVRAYLYGEKKEELIYEMTESMGHLIDTGCNRIILACNTSHLFLPEIYQKIPKLEDYIVNIIDVTVDKIVEEKIDKVFLIASEGTIDSNIYQKALEKHNIKCLAPTNEEYKIVRECIEVVKQNKNYEEVEKKFLNLINREKYCILGCTEMPILYQKFQSKVTCKKVFDPCMLALMKIKEEFDD